MRNEILAAVKTSYLKYGLKAESTEKLVGIIEARLTAMGTIEPDKLQDAINESVKLFEPSVALIQSEVESRITKQRQPEPPAPPTPPAPPVSSETEPEWAKTLRLQMESFTKAKDLQAKEETKQDVVKKAAELAKKQGATNDVLLQKAIKLTPFSDDMTPEKLSGLAVAEYNELQSSFSKEGAVPVIPTLGDKATVEAAQKMGVELVAKYAGKPKP